VSTTVGLLEAIQPYKEWVTTPHKQWEWYYNKDTDTIYHLSDDLSQATQYTQTVFNHLSRHASDYPDQVQLSQLFRVAVYLRLIPRMGEVDCKLHCSPMDIHPFPLDTLKRGSAWRGQAGNRGKKKGGIGEFCLGTQPEVQGGPLHGPGSP